VKGTRFVPVLGMNYEGAGQVPRFVVGRREVGGQAGEELPLIDSITRGTKWGRYVPNENEKEAVPDETASFSLWAIQNSNL
jgi:hypothetical protein